MERFLKSRYRIGRQLSENPFSVTYQGAFLGSNKPVIIKIYKRGTLNSRLINRMKVKVKELSLLSHPNLAKLIDGDYGWQGFYYVREYLDGQNLKQIIAARQEIGVDKAVLIAEQVGRLLEIVHNKGIIHGALSPSNIFIDVKGVVKVADFVIEGEIKEAMPQKAITLLAGGLYVSPEELAGQAAAASADIYALGLILFELISLKSPVAIPGLQGGLQRLRGRIDFDQAELAKLPGYLKEIIAKAVEADPARRFPSIADFCLSLESKRVVSRKPPNEEYITIFENTVTQYGGEELKPESEALQEVGQVNLRWGKEKHRHWILTFILLLALVSGLIYAFLFGR